MPRPEDSGGPSYPRHFGYFLCCLRGTLKPSASATSYLEAVPALQGARHPYGPNTARWYRLLQHHWKIYSKLLIKTLRGIGYKLNPPGG
jgi:hypothetical protein